MRPEVHVWLARPGAIRDAELLDAYRALLTDEERARGDRFRFRRHGDQFLITRALVRTRLSYYFDVPAEDWRFEPGAHGRPEISRPAPDEIHALDGISFNLSHTEGLIACSLSFGRVIGCDVEDLERRVGSSEIANRFFAPGERRALDAAPAAQRTRRFLEFWTLKEAYLKACGTGLSTPLESFTFELGPPCQETARRTIRVRFDGIDDDPRSWTFDLLHPDPAHVLAIAYASPTRAPILVRECIPLLSEDPRPEPA